MSALFSPVLHAASGQWMLGKIEDNAARPLTREEIEGIVKRVTDLEETEQLWEYLEQLAVSVTGDEGEDHAGVVLVSYLRGMHRMLKQARCYAEMVTNGAEFSQSAAQYSANVDAAKNLLEEIEELRPIPEWGATR